MKCDERGNIWVTGPKGVWVISSGGEHLGTIEVPENVGNITWGGADWHTLFMPSTSSLYSIRTLVGPRREPYMSVGGEGHVNDELKLDAGALRDADPGPAERRHDRRRRVRRDGLAATREGPERRRERRRPRCGVPGKGVPVIHVWYVVEPGAPGLKLNAPLFHGVKDTNGLVRGTWGAAPAEGLEPQRRRLRRREDAHERLAGHAAREHARRARPRHDHRHGAWTNMSIEHTSRTGADKGFAMVVPEDGARR